MGDLTLALRVAQSGLLSNQEALHNVSNNVSNINTVGYSRKIINFEQVSVNGVGAGTQISEITRSIDQGLLKSLRIERGEFNNNAIQDDFYTRMQELFGSPSDNNSIAHLMESFGEAMELLAVSPDKSLEAAEVVRRAADVTEKMRDMSETIQELRLQADKEIAELIGSMNTITTKIDKLNDDIISNSSVGRDTTDLKDQRDLEIDKLTDIIDIRYFFRSDGDVVVFTESGRTLVDTIPPTLTHVPASSVSATSTHSEGDIAGIFVGTAIASNDITNDIREGQLKGLVDLRDSVLPNLQAELDELASDLRDVLNQVHNRGVPFPGSQTMSGSRIFIRPTEQTMTLDSGGDDVAITLFDSTGNQSATTTLETIMTSNLYGTSGSQVQAANGPWTITEVAAQVEDWLQANGASGATASIGTDGKMAIALNTTSLNLAFRDEAATADGSTAEDVVISYDANGDGVSDETVSGFSYFFGLNDFLIDSKFDNQWESRVVATSFASPTTSQTLTFRDAATGTIGTLAVTSGTSLTDLATNITNNITNITATVVPEGDGSRLRISHDNGSSITVTQATGNTLLTELGLATADTGVASVLQVRTDIQSAPAKISTARAQWNAALGTGGQYFMGSGDDTIAQQLVTAMTSTNTFEKAGGLATKTATFAGYASEILSANASLAGVNERELESQRTLVESLQFKSDSVRGVNLDQEMADLLVFEQAFAAAARVIAVIQSMIDALDRAIQ
ncbi:MAG: flagellar hook-associated protein FlgK [Rhodospirillaceae bacterium]|nr:flagellar hook-associated protein FlgK [Rhodospirillaceae bacterium]